jgi:hypothetical protein
MKALITASVVLAMVFASAVPASAAAYIDATFSAGSLPSDQGVPGYNDYGTVKPVDNVDTTAGLWNNNLPDGDSGYWYNTTMPGLFTSNVVYGYAEITQSTFSTNKADERITHLVGGASTYIFDVQALSGIIEVTAINTPGHPTDTDITVANTDGLKHIYGWELDRTANTLNVFFDNVQVGSTINVAGSDSPEFYFGDGTRGLAHNESWDRFTIASGAYPGVHNTPEPSAIVIMISGLLGLLCYAWRKRK